MGRVWWILLGLVVACVLQCIAAPALVLFGAQPNFMLIFALAYAATRQDDSALLVAFFAGLLYDLMGVMPLGFDAVLFTLGALVVYKSCTWFGAEDPQSQLVFTLGTLILLELAYLAFGVFACHAAMLGSLVRCLVCLGLDALLLVVCKPLVRILYGSSEPARPSFSGVIDNFR